MPDSFLLALLHTARRREDRVAVEGDDHTATYGDLLQASEALGRRLLDLASSGEGDLKGQRVGLLASPGAGWVEGLLGIWRAGGHAVPLALAHPEPELEHVLTDSGAAAVVVQAELHERIGDLAARLHLPIRDLKAPNDPKTPTLPDLADEAAAERPALLLYTSGTTGKPKGVPIRFRHLEAQVRSLSEAWNWREDDHILGVLPLHHVHGIVNVVLSALWNGATCTLHHRFDAERVWRSFTGDAPSPFTPTLFMAVPTIYRRLVDEWQGSPEPQQRRSDAARGLRLMVSGSAALPETTLERWREMTGHTLLERYGMTEIGMALSQPLEGPRIAGTVGGPLPGVEVRIVGDELQVRGPGIVDGYWRRPEETAEAFTDDGFFRTGDVAELVTELDGEKLAGDVYRLLGRRSVDILKSGGEKISALEIEAVLRRHGAVADAAVVGVADPDWGQRVVAFVELRHESEGFPRDSEEVSAGVSATSAMSDELRAWCHAHLAAFKVPKSVEIVEQLPRNVLGKVLKGRLHRRNPRDA